MLKPEQNVNNNPHDSNQDTQVLYNESVTIVETIPGWYKVATPGQTRMENNNQVPHKGWVEEKHVALQENYNADNRTLIPLIVQKVQATVAFSTAAEEKSKLLDIFAGTKLYALESSPNGYQVELIDNVTKRKHIGYINKQDVDLVRDLKNLNLEEKRTLITEHARKFLDTLYFWGGLTKHGIDCSGLTHLCYRMASMPIPRDSKDQYIAATKCAPKALQMGDLIFLARTETPEKICHVILYRGNDQIIDAFGSNVQKVRITTGQEWLGKSFTHMEQAEQVGPYVVYGGTYFK
jgi:hypothetical protein